MSLELQNSFLQGMMGGMNRTGTQQAAAYRRLYDELKSLDNKDGDANPTKDKVAFSQSQSNYSTKNIEVEYRARATKLKGEGFQIELFSNQDKEIQEYERITVTPESITKVKVDTLGTEGLGGYISVQPNKNTQKSKQTFLEAEQARFYMAEGIISTANTRP